jgi:hypothetical protein
MTPANKLKLNALLNELYEQGTSTEDIVEVITDGMTSSDQITLIEDILTGVKDKDQVSDFIERSARDLIEHSKVYKDSLLEEYEAKYLLKHIKESEELDDYVQNRIERESALIIPPKMLTLDKISRLEYFIKTLFPYQNEQSQIQINF